MPTFLRDLQHAFRVLARRPRYTVAALLALALGIGANTAIFSVFDALLLRPLDYPEPDSLVRMWTANEGKSIEQSPISPVAFADIRDNAQSFDELAGWWRPDLNLTSGNGDPLRVRAVNATDDFFDVFGIAPHRGRTFIEGEDVSGAARIAVLGHSLWQSRFGSRDDVVGENLDLDGVAYEIVGVMPSGFDFPDETEIWLPLYWDPHQHYRGARFFGAVGRVEAGVTVEEAKAEVARFYDGFARDFAGTNKGWISIVNPLKDDLVGGLRPALNLLLAAAAFVLLIACANVANLLLAQGASRNREVAVRGALGASGGRLVWQFLSESLLLGLLGGFLGAGVAVVGVRLLVAMAPPDLPRLEEVGIHWGFLAIALGISVFSSLLFGLAPAWQARRTNLVEALGEGSRGQSSGLGGRRLRSALVVGEVALAMILLTGAGLLVRSLDRLLDENPGFRSQETLAFNLQLPSSSYEDWLDVVDFYDRLLGEMRGTAGIESVAVTAFLPLEPGWRVAFNIDGREQGSDRERPESQYHVVSKDYFQLMGIPLEKGRGFVATDIHDKPGVVVINRACAERYWPGEDPVGVTVTGAARQFGPLGRLLTETLDAEIVGVVGDVKNTSLEGQVEPAFYFPSGQFSYRSMNVIVRGSVASGTLLTSGREAVWRLDPELPLAEVKTLDQHLSSAVAERRFVLILVSSFAGLALALAAIGIYGVISFLAQLRRQEVGIRIALGASRSDVMRLVVGQGLGLVITGVAIGTLGAVLLRRTLEALVYGVGTTDPVSFAVGLGVLVLAALAACLLPAWRMARAHPADVLHNT